MMFFTSIICGLGMALGWGVGDFASKKVVDGMGSFAPILVMQTIFTLLACGGGLLLGIPLQLDRMSFVFVIIGSLLLNLAWFYFYKALDVGHVSIMSALYTLYVLIPLSWQFFFEGLQVGFFHLLGMLFLLTSAVLVSLDLSVLQHKVGNVLTKGLREILLAALFMGIGFMFTNKVAHNIGWRTSYFYQQLFSIIEIPILLVLFGKIKESRLPQHWPWFLMVVAWNLLAFLSLNYGMEHGYVGIVTLVGSFATSVTALMAWVFLKEKLVLNQYIGIGVGILGLIGLSL